MSIEQWCFILIGFVIGIIICTTYYKFRNIKVGTTSASHNTDNLKLLLRCRDYIAGVSGRSIKGDELLNELNEQLLANT